MFIFKYWKNLYKKQPNSRLNTFNLAVAYHKVKLYQKALPLYKKIIESKSKLKPIALYYSAKILQIENKDAEVKNLLSQIDIKSLPKNLKKRVLLFKNQFFAEELLSKQKTKSQKKWNGSFGMGYGANTNPQYIAADDTNEEESTEGQTSFDIYANYFADHSDVHDFNIYFSSYGKIYSESSDSNYDSYAIGAPINYYLGSFRLQLKPTFTFDRYSGESFSNTTSGTLDFTYKYNSSYFSIGYTYDDIDILDEDNYFYLEGNASDIYFKWRYVNPKYSLSITETILDNNYQDSDTVSPSYEGLRTSIYFRYLFEESETSLSAYYETREYSFDVTENDTRKDSKITLGFYYGYFLNQNWTLSFDLTWIDNNSNFDSNNTDNKNYQQTSGSLGLKYYFD